MAEKINFLGGLTNSLREEYKERLKYKKLINIDGLFDIWYDNYDYGILNKNYEPVVLAEDPAIFKSFPRLADGVRCLGFVADAFMEFRNEYTSVVDNSTLQYPPFLEQMAPVLGHESFEELFAHWSEYSITKYSSFLQSDRSITNVDDFITVIKEIFKQQLHKFPITKSGFCMSKQNDIKTTGLILELANLNYDIDLQKGEMIQSRNFSCYMKMANKHGFYVDKNAPWRLMANLDSPYMRSAIRGLTDYRSQDFAHRDYSTIEILDSIYRVRTHFDDVYNLQDFISRVYNQMIRTVPTVSRTVMDSKTNTLQHTKIFREASPYLQTNMWLDLLVFVRLLEVDKYTEELYMFHCEKIKRINSTFSLRRALSIFGSDIAELIKEDFTKNRNVDTMIRTQSKAQEERTNRNSNETRISTTSNPSSGY